MKQAKEKVLVLFYNSVELLTQVLKYIYPLCSPEPSAIITNFFKRSSLFSLSPSQSLVL